MGTGPGDASARDGSSESELDISTIPCDELRLAWIDFRVDPRNRQCTTALDCVYFQRYDPPGASACDGPSGVQGIVNTTAFPAAELFADRYFECRPDTAMPWWEVSHPTYDVGEPTGFTCVNDLCGVQDYADCGVPPPPP
jgi:hypothetical protein